jgi:CRP/FNR family transcriptional regulator
MGGQAMLMDVDQLPEECRSCVIRHNGICSALTGDQLNRLSSVGHHRRYKAGQMILSPGDQPYVLAAVNSGVVKLSKLLVDGRQQIVGLLFPPDILGGAFAKQVPYFAVAATEVKLCCFRLAEFEDMLKSHPQMTRHMLEHSQDKLDSAHDWMVLLGRKTAKERVASLLYLLATRSKLTSTGAGDSDDSFELHLKREEMADYLGLTYETVIRQIRALDEKQTIRLNGRRNFSVPNLAKLAEAAGGMFSDY